VPAEPDRPARAASGGAGSGTGRREDLLCDACYFERFDLIDAPEQVQVRVCASCGAVHRGNRWVDVGATDYTDVAVEAVSEALAVHVDADEVAWAVEPEQVDPTTIRMHCTFTGVVRGTPVEETVTVPVNVSKETCTRCGRIAGDYYAGTVQVRAEGRDPTPGETERAAEIAHEVVAEMSETGDRDAFVTEVSEVDGGLDVKVSTNKIGGKVANRIVSEFGGSVSSSETLVTEDGDGNEVYRVSFAVRLPRFRPGEVVDPGDDEGPVLVRSVKGNVKGRRLSTGEPYEAAHDEIADATRLGRIEDAEETTLVAVEDDRAVQVLDPETYEAKTVPRPADVDVEAETVRVFKSQAGLYVVPEDGSASVGQSTDE
jgi:nonsense-mediated mRNA decay protein 3